MESEGSGVRNSQATSMNDERAIQLEELGFVWALRLGPDTSWRRHFQELTEFLELHQHAQVPGNYPANIRLGEWAAAQREFYRLRAEGKESNLDDEKVTELDSLGFSWVEPSPEIATEVDRVAAEAHVHVPLDYYEHEEAQMITAAGMEQYVTMGEHETTDSLGESQADSDRILVDENPQGSHEI